MAPEIRFTHGQLLKGYRNRAGMTLRKVSEACVPSMSPRTIQRIEAGADLTHGQLAALARAIGLSDEEIDCVAEAARAGGGAS